MKRKACKRWGRGKKIGGRREGIRPKRAYLLVPTCVTSMYYPFLGTIHWTRWIVIFFSFFFFFFFFFNLLTSILILRVSFFFRLFTSLRNHQSATQRRDNTQQHATTQKSGDRQAHQHVLFSDEFSLREKKRKKKDCTQKESEALRSLVTPFRKRAPASR